MILLFSALLTLPALAGGFESDLRDALAKNDWPGLIQLLGPRRGQNIEHDLLLARAYLQLEKRAEAMKLLSADLAVRRDDRAQRMLQVAGEMFFQQETAQLHSEGLRLVSQGRFPEAQEKWEQAHSREPGNTLILVRLFQMDLLLSKVEPALQRWKELSAAAPYSMEARLLAIQLQNLAAESGVDVPRMAPLARRPEREVPFVFQLEQWRRQQRFEEIRAAGKEVLSKHPEWAHAQAWLLRSALFAGADARRLKELLDRNLKQKDRFDAALEKEMRITQQFWAGYIRFEELQKALAGG